MHFDKQTPGAFAREEDGNVTIFSIFMLVLILTITGASVDIMRFEATRAKMQSTMDRAVLAAADLDQKQDPTAVVNDYMAKAGLSGVISGVNVDEGSNFRVVTGQGSADMDTIFLRMSGFDSLTAPAKSVAEEKIANVEISLVLDISGSMRWNNRMINMKPAAQAFVNKVMSDETNGVTTLNVVPFAGQVNPGSILFDYFRGERPTIPEVDEPEPEPVDPVVWEDNGDYFAPWAQAISNIVMYFDTNGDDIYDRAHKIQNFPENAPRDVDAFYKGAVAYVINQDNRITDPSQFLGISIKGGKQTTRYFQVKGDQNASASDIGPTKNTGKIPGSTYSYGTINYGHWAQFYTSPNPPPEPAAEPEPVNVNMPSSCVEIYANEFANTEMPVSEDYVPHFNFWPYEEEVMDWGWCPGEDMAVQYYSSDREHLVNFIGDMRMHDGTGLQYGMKYGLALLDPDNRDEVSHLIQEGLVDAQFEGRPIAWNDPETEKYIVIMTDGQTTDQYRPNDPTLAINGEVALQDQGGASYHNMSNMQTNIGHLMQQCNLAKSLGVTVFTIAYETSNAAQNDMRNCASSASHFFNANGASGIADAFDTIARQINNLRLIQ